MRAILRLTQSPNRRRLVQDACTSVETPHFEENYPDCGRSRHDAGQANRVITVTIEKDRLATPIDANTNRITEDTSNGWSLIYCKGPEGEQLEFVQVLAHVKQVFDGALKKRQKAVKR